MSPKRDVASSTAERTCSASVTSRASASAEPGKASARSRTASALRAVTTARCPRSSTAWASARPSPVEQPVMNQVVMSYPFERGSGGSAELAERLHLVRLAADQDGVVREQHRLGGRVLPGRPVALVGVDRHAEALPGLRHAEGLPDDGLARRRLHEREVVADLDV